VAQFYTTVCWNQSLILNMEISQGSVVTGLKCSGIFNEDLIVNLIVSPSVK